ncbi:peptidase C56, partial [Streptomyces sp. SAS_269]
MPGVPAARVVQPVTREGSRTMTQALRGMRVGILATDGVERVELDQPRGALQGAGAKTEID